MEHHQDNKHIFWIVLCLLAVTLLSGCASHDNDASGSVYLSSDSPMQDVQIALNRAKENDTLLLVVMGAQWCHDSRGLVEQFATPEMTNILAQSYEIIYVDVGYYKDLRTISNRFGQAHYFATPTVMIIDSTSEKLINAEDLAMWGSADSLPLETYISYFTKYADMKDQAHLSPFEAVSEENMQIIKRFEREQAARLQYAYGILVPDMLREDISGQTSDEFTKRWVEVRRYRMNLQRDIQSLYKKMINLQNERVKLPVYEPFSWE